VQELEGQLIYSAGDLTGFLACDHLTQLEIARCRGELEKPHRVDELLDLLAEKGQAHETAFKEQLEAEGRRVVSIEQAKDRSLENLEDAAARTVVAMQAGADVIYQAVLFDGRWLGYADFLERVEKPSDLGSFSYEVLDTKLARSPKAPAILQLCSYSNHVARIQGAVPEAFHLVLGNGERRSFRFANYSAYYRMVKKLFDQAVDLEPDTYPEPVDYCSECRWITRCSGQRRADDHLTFVAQMRRDQIKKLRQNEIPSLTSLAESEPSLKVTGIASPSFVRLQDQAAMQLEKKRTGESSYKILERPGPGYGLERLPAPSKGDIFFDIEADQFAGIDGLEFLFGWIDVSGESPEYRCAWAHSEAEEKQMFEDFIDFITARRAEHPEMHVYHYAPYETTALKKLMGRYSTREDELDRLLREQVFVDLYQVVRQGLRVSEESYSIKKLETFYMEDRTDRITESSSATIEYERFLKSGEESILRDLEDYNEADCISMVYLQSWLEERREDAVAVFGEEVTRPDAVAKDLSEAIEAATEEVRASAEHLTRDLPDDPKTWSREQRANWLLAQLLNWHRREEKSQWWAHFDRLEKTPQELVDDGEALGDLTYIGDAGEVDRSLLHRFTFPPQEHKIRRGDKWIDPQTEKQVIVTELDDDKRTVIAKRGRTRTDAFPRAIAPGEPVKSREMKRALLEVGADVIKHGMTGPGRFQAARQLLMHLPPRVAEQLPGEPLQLKGEESLKAACRIATKLEDSFLPIQGPPGTGKTYTGAHMIVELAKAGRTVGISANSHKVITNLLAGACKEAGKQGLTLKALQKCSEDEQCAHNMVTRAGSPREFKELFATGNFQVFAGTAWIWCADGMHKSIDTIFIDEAGQFSLANTTAVSTAASNLVLLGDPQQLAQPSQGFHPPGAGRSVLEHVLDGRPTIDASEGLFLEKTWRMHPAVTSFISKAFYEDRLESQEGCENQILEGSLSLPSPGIYLAEVPHEGSRIASREEADFLNGLIQEIEGLEWTKFEGESAALESEDLLVVAPYNAQVSLLHRRLPDGTPAGTVDKFQGQEGAVAFYSMTTSHPEDIPRNFEFLYSHNRLNVAISRARVAAVLVCSPDLLRARCKTPEQMRLINALCLYAEMATHIDPQFAAIRVE
jgi:uncharacterized protein